VGVILGFDPGGRGAFGWCVSADDSSLPLKVLVSGTCDAAEEAVVAACDAVPMGQEILSAGIDAPLVWPLRGSRIADKVLRRAIRERGAPSPGGTVQEVNSLRGACLVQGVLAAKAIRDRHAEIRITEAHPKALLFLLDASYLCDFPQLVEHERDAALATISGWACIHHPDGWSDLFQGMGDDVYHVIDPPVAYWMPIATS